MTSSIKKWGVGAGLAIAVAVGYLATSGQYVPSDRDTLARLAHGASAGDTVQLGSDGQWAATPLRSHRWQSGYRYLVPQSSSISTGTLATGTLRCAQVAVPNQVTVTGIGTEITSAGDVGSHVRLGIYADDGAEGVGDLLVDAGQIDGHSATSQEITGLSVPLSEGPVWVCTDTQNVSSTQPTLRTILTVPNPPGLTSTPAAGANYLGLAQTGVTGALPASGSSITIPSGSIARTWLVIQ